MMRPDRDRYLFWDTGTRPEPGGKTDSAVAGERYSQSLAVRLLASGCWVVDAALAGPWRSHGLDRGTLRSVFMSFAAGLLKQTGGAGLNGDSLPFLPEAFWQAGEADGHPLVLQVCTL